MNLRLFLPTSWTAALVLAPALAGAIPLRNLQIKAHLDEYPPGQGLTNYSACWSYVHHDGREYAAIGVGRVGAGAEGTAIYNVSNPTPYRVAFIPGPPSLWREMKQYRNWLYVVTEGAGPGEGLQIIRMTDPESPVLAATYTGNFHRSHTVSVDTSRALLICNGTRVSGGGGSYYPSGMRILSLANPEAPVELSGWPAVTPESDTLYVHDSVPVGNRLYASSIYHGIQRVLDITNPSLPVQIASWTYPGGFTHNAWPDKTGNWLYATDERNGEPLKIFDISNLSAPVLFNTYTPNPEAIVHNAHVWGDELYLANYTEGIRVLDISDPGHPAEYAYADTWGGISGDFSGVWDVTALPSGTVIASDRNSGLWVFQVQRNYGLLRVKITDAGTGLPILGAKLFRGMAAESLVTTADGVAVFALDPGSHTINARRFGYHDGVVTRSASVGSRDTVVVALQPKPTVTFSGVVREAGTQVPLEEAEVVLAYGPLHDHTDAAGQFSVSGVPEDFYRVEVRRPGYVPVAFNRSIGSGHASMSFELAPAASWDPLETGTGWVAGVVDDTAIDNFRGKWLHGDPPGTQVPNVGVVGPQESPGFLNGLERGPFPAHEGHREAEGLRPGPVEPADDRTPSGTKCFFTGQGTSSTNFESNDVDGRTTLVSPTLNATGMAIPTIGYWRWFYTSTGGANDYLAVSISNDNGLSWVPVDTTRNLQAHWQEEEIRVADFVAPTSQVKLRFVAMDGGGASVVEAAIDDVTLYDAALQPVGSFPEPAPLRLAFRKVWPNPARGTVRAILDLPVDARVQVEVLDLQGRRVATVLDRMNEAGPIVVAWDGKASGGRSVEAGVYFFRARVGTESITTRFASIR